MKKAMLAIVLAAVAVMMVGCDDDDDHAILVNPEPEPPQNVYSVTGDNAVYVFWSGPYRNDISEFIVKRSSQPTTGYQEIGRTAAVDNPDLDLIYYSPGYVDNTAANGFTYYYVVQSVDNSGRVSELSAEEVMDTPRPEGMVDLYDYAVDVTRSGFSFAAHSRVDWDSPLADVYVDRADGIFYVNVGNVDTYLQDVGYHNYFEDMGWAPQTGWSERGWMEIIDGHIYVVRTSDTCYAKLWVVSIGQNAVSLAWAYQASKHNPELAPQGDVVALPARGPEYLSKNISGASKR